jgi:hypothetical protein
MQRDVLFVLILHRCRVLPGTSLLKGGAAAQVAKVLRKFADDGVIVIREH